MFTLKVDAREVLSFVQALSDEAPRAIEVAVNRTAEDGNDEIWKNVQRQMVIRKLQRNFVAPQVLPKQYRADARKGKLWALLETRGIGAILDPFEAGEPHRQTQLARGNSLLVRKVAMPSMGAGGLRVTPRTVIPRALYPVNLGLTIRRDAKSSKLYYATGKGAIQRGVAHGPPVRGKQGTWLMPGKKPGVQVVWQRPEGHNQKARPLWFLLDQVKRPANLHFLDSVQRVVDQRWVANMEGAIDWAIRRASMKRAARHGC